MSCLSVCMAPLMSNTDALRCELHCDKSVSQQRELPLIHANGLPTPTFPSQRYHTSWTENLKYFRKNCLGVWLCGGVWNGGQSLLLNCKHRTCIHCTWKMSVPIILSCYMQTCLDLHNVVCLMLTRDFLCCWIYPHADQGCFLWGKRGSASLKNGMGK